jgi:hypothetical protein
MYVCVFMSIDMQEPTFKAYQASDVVQFVVRKESRELTATARIIVLASNVASQYGLHYAWRTNVGDRSGVNGIGSTSAVRWVSECGAPVPCDDFNTSCTTIWLQPSDMSCADTSAIAVSVDATKSDFTDETGASIVLDLSTHRLPEGLYNFTLHLPVANSTKWQYQPIPASLEIASIADATRSESSVCQVAVCALSMTGVPRFNSTNGGGAPLEVTIFAKDADGFELKRKGETIAVVLLSRDVAVQTIQAVFSPETQRYSAKLRGSPSPASSPSPS